MSEPVVIRRAESVADYRACQDAQRLAWGIREDGYVVPVATMVGAQHHGGLVLGAFLPDNRAAGMSFAFPGRVENRHCLYSQLTGVVPGYQDQGIGHRLKTTQRAIAHEEGVPCIAWAFDPLQAGNARFNLEKLGATGVKYIENMYGFRSDSLNLNTPTDRMIATWETAPRDERPATDWAEVRDFFRLIQSDPRPAFRGLPPDGSSCLLEVPDDVNRLRADEPEIAETWGTAVRIAFLAAFDARYRAVGFVRADGGRRGFYLLRRPT